MKLVSNHMVPPGPKNWPPVLKPVLISIPILVAGGILLPTVQSPLLMLLILAIYIFYPLPFLLKDFTRIRFGQGFAVALLLTIIQPGLFCLGVVIIGQFPKLWPNNGSGWWPVAAIILGVYLAVAHAIVYVGWVVIVGLAKSFFGTPELDARMIKEARAPEEDLGEKSGWDEGNSYKRRP